MSLSHTPVPTSCVVQYMNSLPASAPDPPQASAVTGQHVARCPVLSMILRSVWSRTRAADFCVYVRAALIAHPNSLDAHEQQRYRYRLRNIADWWMPPGEYTFRAQCTSHLLCLVISAVFQRCERIVPRFI